jgi:NAD(P)-dependent dehydrogenase (short-subunit alcohol dehydrogenase family)
MRASFSGVPRLEDMQLTNKTAVIYGARGAVGTALTRAFTAAGAKVAAPEIDALDEQAIDKHLATLDRVDISVNAMGIGQTGVQGIPLVQLSADAYLKPVDTYVRSHFLTARAAARRMVAQKSGVILVHTANPSVMAIPMMGGMPASWAALEVMMTAFSVECGPHGVRALTLRTTGLPETGTIDEVYGLHAKAHGITREQFQGMLEQRTHRGRHN